MQPLTQSRYARQAIKRGSHFEWMVDIIMHLREDLLLTEQLSPDCAPGRRQIRRWVQDHYYPELSELSWYQAVMSLLLRIRSRSLTINNRNAHFTGLAIKHLQGTSNAETWH